MKLKTSDIVDRVVELRRCHRNFLGIRYTFTYSCKIIWKQMFLSVTRSKPNVGTKWFGTGCHIYVKKTLS